MDSTYGPLCQKIESRHGSTEDTVERTKGVRLSLRRYYLARLTMLHLLLRKLPGFPPQHILMFQGTGLAERLVDNIESLLMDRDILEIERLSMDLNRSLPVIQCIDEIQKPRKDIRWDFLSETALKEPEKRKDPKEHRNFGHLLLRYALVVPTFVTGTLLRDVDVLVRSGDIKLFEPINGTGKMIT